jgi:chromosome partitioning protein
MGNKPENLTARTAASYKDLVMLVGELEPDHDLIVIDSPPRIAESTKAALILSTLTLIPLGASAAEIWATADLLNTIEAAKAVKGKVDARILWNRFRASTNSAKELSESVRTELDLKQLSTKIGYRVAYSEALARGMTALEWNDRQAQTEMLLLGAELNQILKTQLWS